MFKKLALMILVISAVAGGFLVRSSQQASAGSQKEGGGFSYASLPDEAALYLNDIAFVRDTVVLPAGDVRVILPPGTYPDTLILTENGERVRNYRISAQGAAVYYSQAAYRLDTSAYASQGAAYIITWQPNDPNAAAQTREVKLEYLMSGAHWTPTYDMQIIDDANVRLAFFAQIQDTAMVLDNATIYLLAAQIDLSQQVNQASQVTMNQYAVGYSETTTLPSLGVGMVDLQYIYPVGQVSADPGDTVYANLVDSPLKARRLLAWNAAQDQQVSVIYKVMNDSSMPFAQGIVRSYQNGLFMGSDYVETTPISSEGSVTVGHLPDVRVHRTESQEYHGETAKSYYQHSVTLEIQNYGKGDVNLIVLDPWSDQAWNFEFTAGEPTRQPDNLLRWDITIPAGGSQTITYQFRTES